VLVVTVHALAPLSAHWIKALYKMQSIYRCAGRPPHRREALRATSALLHAAGHLLITSASLIRRIIEGAELWQPQREAEYTATWN